MTWTRTPRFRHENSLVRMLVRTHCRLPRPWVRGIWVIAPSVAPSAMRSMCCRILPCSKHPDNFVGLSLCSGEPMSRNNRLRNLALSVVTATALGVCGAAAAFTKPDFPRIAGVQVGSPFNFNDATYQANLAKQSVIILGNYPGLQPGGSMNNDV